jgi:hypothetical protein
MVNNLVTVRRCSFCRSSNHNILSCNHSLLTDFQNNLHYKKNEIERMDGISLFEKVALFESWILYQCVFGNTFLIKAYSVRYLNCTMRDTTDTYIKKICDFIWENEIIHGETVNSQEIEIEWFFDRSGDPNLLPSNSDSNLTTNINILVDESYHLNVDLESEFKLEECSICYESIKTSNMVKINCAHEFCGFCIKKIMNSDIKNCAFCREKIDYIKVKTLEMENILLSSNVN